MYFEAAALVVALICLATGLSGIPRLPKLPVPTLISACSAWVALAAAATFLAHVVVDPYRCLMTLGRLLRVGLPAIGVVTLMRGFLCGDIGRATLLRVGIIVACACALETLCAVGQWTLKRKAMSRLEVHDQALVELYWEHEESFDSLERMIVEDRSTRSSPAARSSAYLNLLDRIGFEPDFVSIHDLTTYLWGAYLPYTKRVEGDQIDSKGFCLLLEGDLDGLKPLDGNWHIFD